MHISSILTGLYLFLSPALASSHVDPEPNIRAASPALLTLTFPPTAILPNPQTLSAGTHASLRTANRTLSALFRRNSTFVFEDVPLGSYLGEIWTGAAGVNTVPMRVDVVGPDGAISGTQDIGKAAKKISVWQTFRGNEWDNKGELLGEASGNDGLVVNVQVLGLRDVFEKRGGFSPLSLLKNPMILIGIVGMALMFGMPKLMENMDPEMKEEFEKQQRAGGSASSFANALTGQGSGGFDAASWLAGSGPRASEGETTKNSGATRSSGAESKGGKRRKA